MRERLRLPPPGPLAVPVLGALAAAEAAVRLLRPRERPRPVAVAAERYFSAEEIERARRFRRGQRRLAAVRAAIELAALAAVVRRPPATHGVLGDFLAARRPRARRRIGDLLAGRRPRTRHPAAAGALVAAGLSAGGTLLGLPLRALARERARRVGLVTQGWGGWAADVAKGMAIETPMAAAGGGVLVAGLRRFGTSWWLPGAAVVTGFGTAVASLAPLLLDPLFNRFEPLPPGELRSEVLDLARRAGVRVREVYEVDASRRTTAVNAYVTGLGPTKRVVLFDTLLRDFTHADVRFVVAHELGHVRFRDVPRGIAHMAATAPAGMLAIARVGDRLARGDRGPAAVPAVALAAALVGPALAVVSSRLSRAVEVRADAFAMATTGERGALVDFERRITLSNVIEPEPPRSARLLATHPSTMERIGLALAAEGRP